MENTMRHGYRQAGVARSLRARTHDMGTPVGCHGGRTSRSCPARRVEDRPSRLQPALEQLRALRQLVWHGYRGQPASDRGGAQGSRRAVHADGTIPCVERARRPECRLRTVSGVRSRSACHGRVANALMRDIAAYTACVSFRPATAGHCTAADPANGSSVRPRRPRRSEGWIRFRRQSPVRATRSTRTDQPVRRGADDHRHGGPRHTERRLRADLSRITVAQVLREIKVDGDPWDSCGIGHRVAELCGSCGVRRSP